MRKYSLKDIENNEFTIINEEAQNIVDNLNNNDVDIRRLEEYLEYSDVRFFNDGTLA